MDQPGLPLAPGPVTPRRRGRPPGATSKRSLDLARYIEATFAGMTPGQQMASVCLVTPKDVKEAKARAAELRITDLGLQPLVLAMVVKAAQLAAALGISRAEAWSALHAERKTLMDYVHQKQAAKADVKPGSQLAQVFMIPDEGAAPALADFTQPDEGDIEFVGDFPDAS